jgi:hypothetical protein
MTVVKTPYTFSFLYDEEEYITLALSMEASESAALLINGEQIRAWLKRQYPHIAVANSKMELAEMWDCQTKPRVRGFQARQEAEVTISNPFIRIEMLFYYVEFDKDNQTCVFIENAPKYIRFMRNDEHYTPLNVKRISLQQSYDGKNFKLELN